tara:strand:- start:618 stop:824 length:207 start_codon:yes stop_codon:yes gene_type:complete
MKWALKNNAPLIFFIHGAISFHEPLRTNGAPGSYHELKDRPNAVDLSAKVFFYVQYHLDIFLEKHLKL